MSAKVLNKSIVILICICFGREIFRNQSASKPYTQCCPQARKRDRITNLLQENKEIKCHRTRIHIPKKNREDYAFSQRTN